MISSQPVVSSHLTPCMRISLNREPAIGSDRKLKNTNQPAPGLTGCPGRAELTGPPKRDQAQSASATGQTAAASGSQGFATARARAIPPAAAQPAPMVARLLLASNSIILTNVSP
jgi:hypothetical protein